MEMIRVDTFVEVVELLPPTLSHRQASHCVAITYDQHALASLPGDWGRTHFQITFYISNDGERWEFQINHEGPRYDVELIVDTIRRLPKLRSVGPDFIQMHVSDVLVACPTLPGDQPDTTEARSVMFHKAPFDNPNGGRPCLDWAIRIGKRVFDD